MPKAAAKKKAKKRPTTVRRSSIDPVLSATDMVERSLRQHETMPTPGAIQSHISDYMRAIGKRGGQISGAKRMENLSDRKRREIARNAAKQRWAKAKP